MKKLNLIDLFVSAIILLLMTQRIIAQYIPLFSHFDEIVLVIFGLLYLIRTLKRRKIYKEDGILCFIVLVLIVLGILGNLYSGYERSTSLIFEAILFWFKSFAVFIFSYSYFNNEKFDSNKIILIISRIVKIGVVLSFVMLISSPFTKLGLDIRTSQMRYGLHPFGFIYPKPAIYSWYCVLFMLILTLENALKEKNNFIFLFMTSVVWLFTLRSRAFVFIIAYWLLYIWMFKIPKNKMPKIKLKHIIILGIMATVVAVPAIQKYFVKSTSSRAILLKTGIDIGKTFFPLGAGFANYGTTASYKEYSDLYYHYGFNKIYGLKYIEGGSNEITDSYWPAIIGEMGFIGLILMLILIIVMYKRLITKTKNNRWSYMCVVFFVITSALSSIATPVFSEDIMIGYVLIAILACYINPLIISNEDEEMDVIKFIKQKYKYSNIRKNKNIK